MEMIFKDIPVGFIKAKVADIKEQTGPYGEYLRIIFTIVQKGELSYYRFSGFVKPTPLRQSKFYRWIKNILGKDPDDQFSIDELIGKECMIYLSKQDNYYSVKDVSMI
jgi:hypothetical protein